MPPEAHPLDGRPKHTALRKSARLRLLKRRLRGDSPYRAASTDALTGLPNSERFRAELAERIASQARGDGTLVVLLLDLDRFKDVNDTLGHQYGDDILRELGPRLAACAGKNGLAARLGGDEFAVVPARATGRASDAGEVERVIEQIADWLLARIQEPILLDEMALEVRASIGIARFPHDGTEVDHLLRHADIAMYAAKRARSGFKLYSTTLNARAERRLSTLGGFRRALAADRIVVHFQPIVAPGDSWVRGAEGLVRWQHPTRGLMPPAAFVHMVEQTGMIGPLTRHVLKRSIAECTAWRLAGRELSVAVNLAAPNLLDPALPRDVERLLCEYGLRPDALQLEITESMIMSELGRAISTVMSLKDLGVRLSVDDFGTGYSSLSNLRRLPIDELKIDRSFVSTMSHDDTDMIIVRSTVNLGHELGVEVVAEGVEDARTLEHLAHMDCDLAQGYYIGRPMPAEAFAEWLRAESVGHERVEASRA